MAIDTRDKQLLNDFHQTQPALQKDELPSSSSDNGVKIGTLLEEASSYKSLKFVWDFSTQGGAISTLNLSGKLPGGSIVIDILAEVITATTSLGTPDFTLKLDAQTLTSVFDPTSLTGISKLTMTPKKATSGAIQLQIATAAATAGKIAFYLSFTSL